MEYAMSRPYRENETFAVGSLPWDNIPSSANKPVPSDTVSTTYPKGIA